MISSEMRGVRTTEGEDDCGGKVIREAGGRGGQNERKGASTHACTGKLKIASLKCCLHLFPFFTGQWREVANLR